MDSLCPVDGETLSRFRDGELPPDEYRKVEAHVPGCVSCEFRLDRYGLADGVLSRAPFTSSPRVGARAVVASLSVAAALVASVATNVLLTAKSRQIQPPLRLSAAPSDTLSSFYEKVARPPGRP